MKGDTGGELRALTSLRFFAAAAIVIHHSQGSFGVPLGVGAPLVLDHAVSFFFVLSGFILTYVHPSLGSGQRRPFLWARIARVWPGHVAVLLLLFLVFGSRASDVGTIDPRVLFANTSLLQAWIPYREYFFSYNGASWSISVEAFFYLTFPFLVYRIEHNWFVKLPLVLAVSLCMVALARVWELPMTETDGVMGTDALVYIHPLARWFEFALGMCTAVGYRRLSERTRWSAGIATALELAAVVLTAFVMYRTADWASSLGAYPMVGMPGSVWLIHGPLAAPAFALLITVLGLGRGLLSRLLSLPFLVLLGEISYALYMLHIPVLRVFWTKLPGVVDSSELWIYPCVWLLLLALSHLFWRGIERPVRSKLVQLWPIPREPELETVRGPGPVVKSTVRRWLVPAAEFLLVSSLFGTFALVESRLP